MLVNNAGADVLTGEAASWWFEQKLERLWQVDVQGCVRLSRDIGSKMKVGGRGSIINIGWDQAERGMAGDSGEMFGTIKGAVMAFTRSLAQSLAPQVRVNCISPGWIAHGKLRPKDHAQHPVGRAGRDADIAELAAYLISDAAGFVTGQNFIADGGMTRKMIYLE